MASKIKERLRRVRTDLQHDLECLRFLLRDPHDVDGNNDWAQRIDRAREAELARRAV